MIVANYSLPFCKKNKFEKLWNKIKVSITNEGYFIGNFFGLKDSWREIKIEMIFLSKEQVMDLFKDFEIIRFKETGISHNDIELDHFMDLNYFKYENNIQVYYGI